MFNRKEEMRLPAAELYALVIVSIDSGTRHTDAIKELTANIKSQVGSARLTIYMLAPGLAKSLQLNMI